LKHFSRVRSGAVIIHQNCSKPPPVGQFWFKMALRFVDFKRQAGFAVFLVFKQWEITR